jgi:ABC-2 type transport system ATP-binding protein
VSAHTHTELAIWTRALTRRFGELVAVNAVSLAVAHGEIFGLIGSNGAGKSTLIKMLTTLLRPSSGEARVVGFDIHSQAAEVRRHIGYVQQQLSADGALTGYENLLLSARLYGIPRRERAARIEDALETMNLKEAANRLVHHYSGGMIRELEIAQAMLHRPALLLMDEPTVGLDPLARQTVHERIRTLRKKYGMTIFLTTHDMGEADTLCGRIALMHRGAIEVVGSPEELKRQAGPNATLAEAFAHFVHGELTAEGYREAMAARQSVIRRG